ncbi:hypothetical protein [Cupriavidus pauculus]|uniref:hypothetical protein n=1 Tax=Cupriavidus pauculus TaxID=82633 RepID=UPI0030F97C6B
MPFKYPDLCHRIVANSVMAVDSFYEDTPCWLWMGKRNSSGYPVISLRWKSGPRKGKVRNALAHRVSLMEFKQRRLSAKSVAKHLCNNPVCVNPYHLAGGTQKSNVRQCVKEGRHFTPFRKHNQPTEEQACTTD